MTVSTTATRVQYDGNGTTTAFAVPFKFLADTDLVVIVRITSVLVDETKTLTSHYSVSGAGTPSGGTVTMHTPPEPTETVLIYNNTPLTQSVDYVSGDAFPAETHEQALDKLTLQQQRTRDLVARSIAMDDGDPADTGPYNAQALRLGNLGTPTGSLDAATKGYVDVAVVNAGLVIPSGVTSNHSETDGGGAGVERSLGERWSERRNPLDFGAVGDGSTDDSEAIQRCLFAVRDNGGIVSFPFQKTFMCQNLDLQFGPEYGDTSPLIIEGNGSVLKAHPDLGSDPPVHPDYNERLLNIAQGTTAKYLVIRDLIFDGNNLDTTYKHLVRLSCDGVHLENCRFTNFKQGGLDLVAHKAFLLNCEFDNLGDTDRFAGVALESSFVGVTTWHQQPRDIRIIGCHFHDLRWYGMLYDGRRAVIEGCIFENIVDTAVRIRYRDASPAYDVQIINNIVRGIRVHEDPDEGISFGIGIALEAAEGIRISGNQIRDCDKYGIRILDCAYVDVSNNVIGNIGRADEDESCDIDGDTTFTMDNVNNIGGSKMDVDPGVRVVHDAFETDPGTYVVSADSGSDTVTLDVAAISAPGEDQTVTFITGGYCIALEAKKTGAGTAVYADDRRTRNISITDNVFYDDGILFNENEVGTGSAGGRVGGHRVPITRGGIMVDTLSGVADAVENVSVKGNVFSPELFNNKQSDYGVMQYVEFGNMLWKPQYDNVVSGNVGLEQTITKASEAYFPLEDLFIGDEVTFVVTGSTTLTRCEFGRHGMRMTLIWAAGATFSIANMYPADDTDTFALRDNNNALGFQAGDSITFECVETQFVDRTCDTYNVGGSGSSVITIDNSDALLCGMSVSGPGIPYDTAVERIDTIDPPSFIMANGAGIAGTANRVATAAGTNVPLTFTSRTWHEVSRSTKVDASGVSTLDDSGTPSVAGGNLFLTGGTTAITYFDDGVVGQTIMVKAEHAVQITDGTNLELVGHCVMADGDSITLTMFEEDKWTEISRSDTT